MTRGCLAFFLFFCVSFLYGQEAISGFVNFDKEEQKDSIKIILSQLSIKNFGEKGDEKYIAHSSIDEEGFFRFDRSLISESNSLYKLQVNGLDSQLGKNDFVFLLSKKHWIHFKRGAKLFTDYETNNEAQNELQRFEKYEAKLTSKYLSSSKKFDGGRKYIKDSLQILVVKLIGLKKLEYKNLLERDISENIEYYKELLSELKKSEISPSEYWFLEKKMVYLNVNDAEQKLSQSRWLNIGLGVLVLVLIVFVFYVKNNRKNVVSSTLSRQEKNIQTLILQGKSNKEIASELFISISTVKTHVTNIFKKSNVTNRQELIRNSTRTST